MLQKGKGKISLACDHKPPIMVAHGFFLCVFITLSDKHSIIMSNAFVN